MQTYRIKWSSQQTIQTLSKKQFAIASSTTEIKPDMRNIFSALKIKFYTNKKLTFGVRIPTIYGPKTPAKLPVPFAIAITTPA